MIFINRSAVLFAVQAIEKRVAIWANKRQYRIEVYNNEPKTPAQKKKTSDVESISPRRDPHYSGNPRPIQAGERCAAPRCHANLSLSAAVSFHTGLAAYLLMNLNNVGMIFNTFCKQCNKIHFISRSIFTLFILYSRFIHSIF